MDGPRRSGARRTRTSVLVLCAALGATGCSSLEIRDVPLPFGPRAVYGPVLTEIRLVGNDVTRDALIRDVLVSEVGEPYTRENAQRDYFRLLQLGVFTSILFETERVDDGVHLTIEVAEITPYLPTISFAITAENGLEIGPGFTSANLLGRAAKTTVYTRFGGARNTGITFRDAWHPSPAWYGCCWEFEFFHRERDNEVYEYRETSDEVTLQFLGNLTERFHVGPRIAYIRLGSEADSLGVRPPVILDPDHTDDIPAAGLVAEFDTRNLLNYPTSGWYFVVSAMQNGGPLGGSVDYGRLEVDVRRYVEITGPRHSLAFYSLFGLTSGDVGVDVPLHQEFSLGGTNSVRGWPIGSRTGKNEWINTAEYWWNILPASAFRFWFVHWSMGLQLAAFADAGTAWNTDREFSRSWIGGGGLGARLTVPQVGLVRFDVALGEDRPDFSLSLHIGGNEKAVAQRRRVR